MTLDFWAVLQPSWLARGEIDTRALGAEVGENSTLICCDGDKSCILPVTNSRRPPHCDEPGGYFADAFAQL